MVRGSEGKEDAMGSQDAVSKDGELVEVGDVAVVRGGREYLNPTPLAPPVGYQRRPSLAQQIRDMVRSERLAQELDRAGFETFEEADDFDVGDDFDPSSPYEEHFDPTPVSELRRRLAEAEAAEEAKKRAAEGGTHVASDGAPGADVDGPPPASRVTRPSSPAGGDDPLSGRPSPK